MIDVFRRREDIEGLVGFRYFEGESVVVLIVTVYTLGALQLKSRLTRLKAQAFVLFRRGCLFRSRVSARAQNHLVLGGPRGRRVVLYPQNTC